VLMVASGYGITAQLPYLKQLLHEYNSRKAKSRRIHLVWTLKTLGTSLDRLRVHLILDREPLRDKVGTCTTHHRAIPFRKWRS
jgi:hypothetical protein